MFSFVKASEWHMCMYGEVFRMLGVFFYHPTPCETVL